jgi:hypothetical protein
MNIFYVYDNSLTTTPARFEKIEPALEHADSIARIGRKAFVMELVAEMSGAFVVDPRYQGKTIRQRQPIEYWDVALKHLQFSQVANRQTLSSDQKDRQDEMDALYDRFATGERTATLYHSMMSIQ